MLPPERFLVKQLDELHKLLKLTQIIEYYEDHQQNFKMLKVLDEKSIVKGLM